jgi:hypothetical protein
MERYFVRRIAMIYRAAALNQACAGAGIFLALLVASLIYHLVGGRSA